MTKGPSNLQGPVAAGRSSTPSTKNALCPPCGSPHMLSTPHNSVSTYLCTPHDSLSTHPRTPSTAAHRSSLVLPEHNIVQHTYIRTTYARARTDVEEERTKPCELRWRVKGPVADGAAVTHDHAVKREVAAENRVQSKSVAATRHIVDSIIYKPAPGQPLLGNKQRFGCAQLHMTDSILPPAAAAGQAGQ